MNVPRDESANPSRIPLLVCVVPYGFLSTGIKDGIEKTCINLPLLDSRVNLPILDSRVNLPLLNGRVNLPLLDSRVNLPLIDSRVNLPLESVNTP